MIRTIALSNYIFIQGLFVRALSCGNIVISTDKGEVVGKPVTPELVA